MACDGSFDINSLQPWARVRDRSVLKVAVETANPAATGGARVLIDHPDGTTEEIMWSHAELSPGPAELTLRAGQTYTVRVRVGFLAEEEAEAVIKADIIRPDGRQHGLPYRYCVHGTKDQVGRSTITVATRTA